MKYGKEIGEIFQVYAPHHFITSSSIKNYLTGGLWAVLGAFVISFFKTSYSESPFLESLTASVLLYIAIGVAILMTLVFERSGYVEKINSEGESTIELKDQLAAVEIWPRIAKLLYVSFLFAALLYFGIEYAGIALNGELTSNLVWQFFYGNDWAVSLYKILSIILSVLVCLFVFCRHTRITHENNWRAFDYIRKRNWIALYTIAVFAPLWLIVFIL